MRVTGIALALMDIPAENVREYNLWYDLDHMPEHVSKPDVVMGRRYVAPPTLRNAPGVISSDVVGGHPPYATIYSFGGPLDFMSQEATDGWRDMDRRILKAGRFWLKGQAGFVGRWSLTKSVARPSIHVDEPAIAHLAHRGIIVALGRAASPERRSEAIAWWDDVHLVDLLNVAGMLAVLRFEPSPAEDPSLLLHVLMCESPPLEVMTSIDQARKSQRSTGRYPAHGGSYEEIAFLPYERIVPLEYPFADSLAELA